MAGMFSEPVMVLPRRNKFLLRPENELQFHYFFLNNRININHFPLALNL